MSLLSPSSLPLFLFSKDLVMILKSFSYIRNKGTKNEWAIKGSPTEESPLKLVDVNLIVGKNATGKTNTVSSLRILADLISGEKEPQQIIYNTGIYHASFDNQGIPIDYFLDVKGGVVIDERLTIDGQTLLDRKNKKLYYQGEKKYFSFQTDENVLAITRRDKVQQAYMEPLFLWGRNLSFYAFGSSLGKSTLMKDVTIATKEIFKPRETDKVSGILVKALKEFEELKGIVINDMSKIGYQLTDIKPSRLKFLPVNAYGILVKEKGLSDYTDQFEMSQGMFRALSLLIQLEYSLLSNVPSCILIDDIGEGLDYERSQDLINIIIEKTKSSHVQVIMTTNNRFIMNTIPLHYWHVINRVGNKSIFYNRGNSNKTFEDFSMTGLNNFDFFATKFYVNGMEAFEK